MPKYYDKITLNDNVIDIKLTSEVVFRNKRFNLDFDISFLRKNINDIYEFLSTKSLLIPYNQFGGGDEISIFTWQGELLHDNIKIGQRQPFKACKSFFPFLKDSNKEDESNFIILSCEIVYCDNDMDWILLGYIPEDMEDRIVIFEQEEKIFIYGFFGGYLMYEGKYRVKPNGTYLIYKLKARKRNVEFSKGELILDFKGYLDNTLNNKKYIEKWSLDFMKK